ncbi:MAG: glycosyltransferase [Rubrivivax sp.]|nr:glycosyltransferase [Rubrivivax sp.]
MRTDIQAEAIATAAATTVSVIVPTFNRASFLPECIDNCLQTVPAHEIVVVDDGSDDATPEVAARYGDRISYVRKANGGKPSAIAQDWRPPAANGWIFDDDDAALPDAIEHRLAALRHRPDAGFVYAPHLLGSSGHDGHIATWGRNDVPRYSDAEFLLEIMRGCFFHLNSCLVRRSLFLQLGGLDPSLFSGEDYDFQIRLARVSKPAFCPEPVFVFRQHEGVRGAMTVRYEARDRNKVFRRYSAAIGRKIRNEFGLGEFLVPPQVQATGHNRRQALINRAHVMANHGCVAEMVDDLRDSLTCAPDRPLTSAERSQIAATIRTGWAYDVCVDDWPGFVAAVRALNREPGGRSVVRALARGLADLATSYRAPWPMRIRRLGQASHLLVTSLA